MARTATISTFRKIEKRHRLSVPVLAGFAANHVCVCGELDSDEAGPCIPCRAAAFVADFEAAIAALKGRV